MVNESLARSVIIEHALSMLEDFSFRPRRPAQLRCELAKRVYRDERLTDFPWRVLLELLLEIIPLIIEYFFSRRLAGRPPAEIVEGVRDVVVD